MADVDGQGRGAAATNAVNRDRQPAFPNRFYREADVLSAEDGFALVLDGKPARTPARNPIVLPSAALGHAVASEWSAVGTVVDPRSMPMTRLVNTVIDGVARNKAAVLDEIGRFAGSDLLVYRAEQPEELVRLQSGFWDPIVAWSKDELKAPMVLAKGVMHIAQPVSSLQHLIETTIALAGAGRSASFRVGALHVMTTLTGSALLALAVGAGRVSTEDAWSMAHVDEDYQISFWGEDAEATARRANRWVDMETAGDVFRLA